MALTNKLTAIADAIRGKTGKTGELTLEQMATEIAGIETGGGGDQSAGLVDGTLTVYESTEVTQIRTYAFYYHPTLRRVAIPNCTGQCNTNAFRNCTKLEFFDSGCASLQTACLNGCTALKTIVLRSAGLCSLVNANALTGTPFASGGTGGTVYVPSALIESYKTATNWSTLYAGGTCNFVAIEGSEYE